MITKQTKRVETTVETFTCDVCGEVSTFRGPLACHYVARHLPHLERDSSLDAANVRTIVWCSTDTIFALVCEANRAEVMRGWSGRFTGPGWYAIEVVQQWDGEDDVDRVRVVSLKVLAQEAEARAVKDGALAMSFRRLAQAPITFPSQPAGEVKP